MSGPRGLLHSLVVDRIRLCLLGIVVGGIGFGIRPLERVGYSYAWERLTSYIVVLGPSVSVDIGFLD